MRFSAAAIIKNWRRSTTTRRRSSTSSSPASIAQHTNRPWTHCTHSSAIAPLKNQWKRFQSMRGRGMLKRKRRSEGCIFNSLWWIISTWWSSHEDSSACLTCILHTTTTLFTTEITNTILHRLHYRPRRSSSLRRVGRIARFRSGTTEPLSYC